MKINLASTKLAFFLIAGLLLLILLSAVIPQQDISVGRIIDWQESLGSGYTVIEFLGLDRIYYTPTFFVILSLLAVNLALGNIRRFRAIYRTDKTLLRLRHFGSVLFHLALLLTMTGVVLHYLYKYEGVFSLTEGQTVHDQPDEYFREFQGPLHVASYGEFSIRLDRISRREADPDPLGSLAEITLVSAENITSTGTVAGTQPFPSGGYEFHFGTTVGYSPEIQVIDSSGRTVFRSFMRVAKRIQGNLVRHYDFIVVPEAGLNIEITVLPVELEPETLRFDLRVTDETGASHSATITTADTVSFASYKLLVPRVRKWCYIGAIKNPFLTLVFSGFWLSLVGLSLSLVGRMTSKRTVD